MKELLVHCKLLDLKSTLKACLSVSHSVAAETFGLPTDTMMIDALISK